MFNIRVPWRGAEALFNSLSGEIAILWQPLQSLLETYPNLANDLHARGFLVRLESSIRDEYGRFFELRRNGSRNISVLLTTTTSCNLTCAYCFENRVARKTMSRETLGHTIDFIRKRLRETRPETLRLTLFGGEPLLAPALALEAIESLRGAVSEVGACLAPIQLLTNGMHHDRAILAALRAAGVARVQISFDGDAATTNQRRRPRDRGERGLNVYSQALGNLKVYSEYFRLTVKVNFDQSTIGSVGNLIDDLFETAQLESGEFVLKPEPIQAYDARQLRSVGKLALFDAASIELAEAFVALMTACAERGIPLDLSALLPTPCMVSQPNSFLIEPDGSIRSCISAFGMPEFGVGDVQQGLTSANERTAYATSLETQDLIRCEQRSCSFLPVCDGGCKYKLKVSGDPIDGMYCRFNYYKAILPHIVRYRLDRARRLHHYGTRLPESQHAKH